MEDIFEYVDQINKLMARGKKEVKAEIKTCYYCKNNADELCHTSDIYIDNKQIYICDKCEIKFAPFSYCHNCETTIESYGDVFMCSKCPTNINILCCDCSRLHDILIKINH